MPLLPPFPNALTWRMLMAFAVVSASLGMAQGFTIQRHELVVALLLLATMLALSHVYTFWRPRPQFAYPTILLAQFVLSGLVFGPLSYFTAAIGMPLIDPQLAAIDAMIGFDWHALQRLAASSKLLAGLGDIVYHTSGFQIFLVWAVLAFTGQIVRLGVFLTAMVWATGVCVVLATLFPAAGAYVHYAVPPSAMGFIKHDAGIWHLTDFEALRAGTMRMIDLSKMEGLVTFPSFHTVVALLCGWALANTRVVGPIACIYSGLVVLTTLPIGGHYLIDVVFGALIMAASVAFGGWANRELAAPALAAGEQPVRA